MAVTVGQRPKGRMCARGAFSLVELCAGLACFAALFAIVQPSLEVARERAKQSVCLERLRSIGQATGLYTEQDPSGWALPVHPSQFMQDPGNPTFVGAYEWGGKSGIGRPDFAPMDPPALGSKYGTYVGFGPATRPLNEILYPHGFQDNLNPEFDRVGAMLDTQIDLPAYRCPADDGPPRGAHCQDWLDHADRSSYDHFGNSYAANIFMIGNSSGSGTMKSNSPYMRPLTRVPNPARTIFYEENIGRWAWGTWRETCDFLDGIDPGPTGLIRGWHGKKWTYNRSFGDAHAEMQKVYIEGTEYEGYAEHYRIELVFDDPGEQSSQRCIIVRGDGWQKDTLPAPYIDTGLANPGGGRPSYEDCVQGSDPP